MKKVLMSLLFSSFLLVGVSFAQAPAAPEPAAPVAMKAAHHEHERHPELHKAIRKLKAAKEDLEKASHDFGGHKVKAIEAINKALDELRDALASDKK